MSLTFNPQLAALVASAYGPGAETSLLALAKLLDLPEADPLGATSDVLEAVTQFGLELVPGVTQGRFESIRVLRQAARAGDTELRSKALIEAGEGPLVEFKSSLMASMHHWKSGELFAPPALPGEVLKTICAFLNTDGGDLLIGVEDGGAACEGIAVDLQLQGWTFDRWQLTLASLVRDRFKDGALVASYVQVYDCTINGHCVVHVKVMARSTRSFVKREPSKYEFFVRNGSQTNSLDLPGFYAHLEARGAVTGRR